MLGGGGGGGGVGAAVFLVANTGFQHLLKCASHFPLIFVLLFRHTFYLSITQPLKCNRSFLNWIEISLAAILIDKRQRSHVFTRTTAITRNWHTNGWISHQTVWILKQDARINKKKLWNNEMTTVKSTRVDVNLQRKNQTSSINNCAHINSNMSECVLYVYRASVCFFGKCVCVSFFSYFFLSGIFSLLLLLFSDYMDSWLQTHL